MTDAAGPSVDTELAPDPPPPSHLGAGLPPPLLEDLHHLLLHGQGQLSDVYRAMLMKPTAGPTELLPLTDCANTGVVGNRRIVVFAILDGAKPKAPSVARQAASTVRSMLKSVTSDATKAHLADFLANLEAVSASTQAVEEEAAKLESDSAELASDSRSQQASTSIPIPTTGGIRTRRAANGPC